ncbi:MAG: hypothetical protein ACI3XA_05735, partial [Clostridia bacterium]
MKKIIALLIIICMLCPGFALADETAEKKIFLFGDDWAYFWGEELKGYVTDGAEFINCAAEGNLLSKIEKEDGYNQISKGDVVILSYGIMEKDRIGDKNAEYEKKLGETVKNIHKKGGEILFVSICSSMRFNSLTGKMEETKNFYTEKTRSLAKSEGITYVDLANLTAAMANKIGSGRINKLYKGTLSLTDTGNRMCAYEVFKELEKIPSLEGVLKNNLHIVKDFTGNRTEIDLFYEEDLFDSFAVYIKNGVNVRVNSLPVEEGDTKVICQSLDGKITVEALTCEKIQVSPIYRFDAKGFETGEMPFEGKMYPGIYDVTVKKTEALKASVYLNGYLIASNLDMPGTQPVYEAAEHTFEEYHLDKNKISVTVTGLTDKLDYIYFAQSPIIYEEKPTIFLAGDSTVCNYYPLLRTGDEEDGTV